MRLEILPKPTLKRVVMNCDDVIDQKLLKYPMIADLFSKTSFNVIVGKMGSGKTSLITNFVKSIYKKCFHNIYVFIPSNSRASIDNDIYGKYLPENQLYETLTEENLSKLYDTLQENSEDEEYSLLIIDDFQTQLKDPRILHYLGRIITKMRHLRTTVWLLQQNFQALAKSLRELVTNLILFNVGKSQLNKIFDEVIQLDKDKYQELIDISFVEKNDWIAVNVNGARNIYKGFDKIIVNDRDEE
jgi:DNA replication protein DnaC